MDATPAQATATAPRAMHMHMRVADVLQAGCLDGLFRALGGEDARDPTDLVAAAREVVRAAHELAESGVRGWPEAWPAAWGPAELPPFQVHTGYDERGQLHLRVENLALMELLKGDYFYGHAVVPAHKVAMLAALPTGASVVHAQRPRAPRGAPLAPPTATVTLTRARQDILYTLSMTTRAHEIAEPPPPPAYRLPFCNDKDEDAVRQAQKAVTAVAQARGDVTPCAIREACRTLGRVRHMRSVQMQGRAPLPPTSFMNADFL